MKMQDAAVLWALSVLALGVGGCAGRTSLFPNSDGNLRKTSAEFAADAAKRTYPANAPRGGEAPAQAAIDHGVLNRIEMSNLSGDNWSNVELWVNQKYVVAIPEWPSKRLEQINFQMLFDRDGRNFPIDNKTYRVEKIELVRDGKLYSVPSRLAD